MALPPGFEVFRTTTALLGLSLSKRAAGNCPARMVLVIPGISIAVGLPRSAFWFSGNTHDPGDLSLLLLTPAHIHILLNPA
jgi:hypothetical protein